MVEDSRVGWLRDLVVGDMVCVSSNGEYLYVYTVTDITPLGEIVVGNSYGYFMVFAPNGTVVGGVGSFSLSPYNSDDNRRKEVAIDFICEMVGDLSNLYMETPSLEFLESLTTNLSALRYHYLNR